jgi:hypothetical protein
MRQKFIPPVKEKAEEPSKEETITDLGKKWIEKKISIIFLAAGSLINFNTLNSENSVSFPKNYLDTKIIQN